MAKAPKSVSRETLAVSQEQVAEFNDMKETLRYDPEATVIMKIVAHKCSSCIAWRPETAIPFGGCAKSGLTTTHYGETRYVHYTPDGASCSAFEAKE